MRFHFAVDFDGTVSLIDTTDHLLERFAAKEWLDVEKEWVAGKIGSRECLARQAALLDAGAEDIASTLAAADIDPEFPAFVRLVQGLGASIEIVSDGFDRCIQPILARENLNIALTSNRLVPVGDRHWRAEFPHSSDICPAMSGVCKCRTLSGERFTVMIGDGRSDFCIAGQADFVLAKGKLAEHCEERGYAFLPISGFADVINWLKLQAEAADGAFSTMNALEQQ
jgi:2-hydroxy-3-keto-5-methylthiopentenyl-1-phosphate phosphatase